MSATASTVLTSSVQGRLVTGTEVAITSRQHEFTIDEPESLGGADRGDGRPCRIARFGDVARTASPLGLRQDTAVARSAVSQNGGNEARRKPP